MEQIPTGDYEDRKVRYIRAGDRVFEAFTLRIELGNAAMSTAAEVADALARTAAMVGETGSWEGPAQ